MIVPVLGPVLLTYKIFAMFPRAEVARALRAIWTCVKLPIVLYLRVPDVAPFLPNLLKSWFMARNCLAPNFCTRILVALFEIKQDWRPPVYSGRFEYIC